MIIASNLSINLPYSSDRPSNPFSVIQVFSHSPCRAFPAEIVEINLYPASARQAIDEAYWLLMNMV